MESLLRRDFTAHYGQPYSNVPNIAITTNESYFEVEDNNLGNIVLHVENGKGMAKYKNKGKLSVFVINYDKFCKALSPTFQRGKKRCDIIVYTNNKKYFLLNELKNRNPTDDVRQKAKEQLLDSLKTITAVNSIKDFINKHNIKHCCIFNKKSKDISEKIYPVAAFNRLADVSPKNGLKMQNAEIESYGFELWEFIGNQTYLLENDSPTVKSIANKLVQLSAKEVKELYETVQLKRT